MNSESDEDVDTSVDLVEDEKMMRLNKEQDLSFLLNADDKALTMDYSQNKIMEALFLLSMRVGLFPRLQWKHKVRATVPPPVPPAISEYALDRQQGQGRGSRRKYRDTALCQRVPGLQQSYRYGIARLAATGTSATPFFQDLSFKFNSGKTKTTL